MAEIKNPEQIFKENGVFTYWNKENGLFEPKDYGSNQILFWHVPELLEENAMNLPAFMLVPGKEQESENEKKDHRHDFYKERALVCKDYFDQEVFPRVLNLPQGTNWAQDADQSKVGILSEKIVKLLHNSSRRRAGAHLVGLYIDASKLDKVFDCSFKEAERIVDNNLVLANLATIYSGFIENSDKFSTTEDRENAKQYFSQVEELIENNPKIHLTPACCIVEVENKNGEDVITSRTYGDCWGESLQSQQAKISLQEDMSLQFVEYNHSQRVAIDPMSMFTKQKELIESTLSETKAKVEEMSR